LGLGGGSGLFGGTGAGPFDGSGFDTTALDPTVAWIGALVANTLMAVNDITITARIKRFMISPFSQSLEYLDYWPPREDDVAGRRKPWRDTSHEPGVFFCLIRS
jgi:hypothetical protein